METATRTYEPTETDLVLADMLTENTGRHMLDSGGAYGRNWERNTGKTAETFYAADPVRIDDWGDGDFSLTLDVFHFLRERVWIDEDGDQAFHDFAKTMPDDGWMQVCEEYAAHLEAEGHEVTGMWGDGEPFWVNTYNGEDALSQVIQYYVLTIDGEEKVLLQIHGGCDVRGGYTAPRMFELGEDYMIFDNARITAATHYEESDDPKLFDVEPVEPKWWDSDNAGYSWSDDDGAWRGSDNKPEWKLVDGQVIYEPWGTPVHFM